MTICTHASQKVKATKSLPKTREKEKWEIIYTHMYIIQYARWQVPSTERPPLDGIYICVKSNAHTPSRTYKKHYFQDRPHGRAATLSRYSLKWEWRQTRLCKHEKLELGRQIDCFISDRLHEIFFFLLQDLSHFSTSQDIVCNLLQWS